MSYTFRPGDKVKLRYNVTVRASELIPCGSIVTIIVNYGYISYVTYHSPYGDNRSFHISNKNIVLVRQNKEISMADKKAIKIGDKVRLTDSYQDYGFPTGTVSTVKQASGSRMLVVNDVQPTGVWVLVNHLESIDQSIALSDLEKEKAELESRLSTVESKIAYLNSTGQTNFNDMEYKCYRAILVMENTEDSRINRAKALKELISGV